MLFKYPQLLWALWLLLIPIIIHLLQLRRFKKTPFTNVKLLQKVLAKSQRSQSLKRWLLLFTRMFLFAALVIAFAQPFFANKSALTSQEIVVYLDNSFSMQMRKENRSLLELSVQDLIENISGESTFSLFTNDQEFKTVSINDIQNSLLQLNFTAEQFTLKDILLKSDTYFSPDPQSLKKLIVISDFQESLGSVAWDSINEISPFLIPIRADNPLNISIDTAYLDPKSSPDRNLVVKITGSSELESTPVSVYNGSSLIAKSAVQFQDTEQSQIVFTLPREEKILGKISLSDAGLLYDNELFFNTNTAEKIKILCIENSTDQLLKKLFTDEVCEYRSVQLTSESLSMIQNQDFLILNSLQSLSSLLVETINKFIQQGGTLLIIPSETMDISNFNTLLNGKGINFEAINSEPQALTKINFDHPLFTDVFQSRVQNFQYPSIQKYFPIRGNVTNILTYANKQAFLGANGNLFICSAPLANNNSNFLDSPLVVPTFYAMALKSRKLPALYYNLESEESVDIPEPLKTDQIFSLNMDEEEVIPRQQGVGTNTRLWFKDNPTKPGTYTLGNAEILRNLSFNFSRDESRLNYMDLDNIKDPIIRSSIPDLFKEFEKDNAVTSLWKWFAILALLFILIEVIIQKVMA